MASTMLLDAGLGKKYWGEAVMTASYLQNRLPSRVVDRTPYEKWFGVKPNLKHLRVFGSVAYVHVPEVKRVKFDAKGRKLVFVGYCEDRKAYRFLDPEDDTITISRDVQFIELKNGSLSNQQSGADFDWPALSTEDKLQEEEEDRRSLQEEQEESEEERHSDGEEDDEEQDAGAESVPPASGSSAGEKRSTRGILPKRLNDYVVNMAMTIAGEPISYDEAVAGPEQDLWTAAMREEFESLTKNKTWKLVDLPAGRKPIGCKWVYRRKEDSEGNVCRLKARLVAQGFTQQYGVDYSAVFSPVANQTTWRVLLSVAGHKQMAVHHLDVKCAYLHGKLTEDIYMQQPPGFVKRGSEKKVCKLERSLYGLKQSARVWNDMIHGLLVEYGFAQSNADPCLYTMVTAKGDRTYLIIYVDDMVVASTDVKEITRLKAALSKDIELTSLGEIKHFLGMRITRDKDGFFSLDQQAYIKKVAAQFGLEHAKGSKHPLDVGYYKNREGSSKLPDNNRYRSLVGALLYIGLNTRPDITASVTILSRQISEPTEVDWSELKRVVRYLMKTSSYKLKLGSHSEDPITLHGYCDSDWSGDTADRKSTTGYLFRLGDATVCWVSRKQTSVAVSSMEAEYAALSEACKELLWLRRLMDDFKEDQQEATTIYEDNRSCIDFVQLDHVSRRSKHIDTRMHFAKDLAEKGVIDLRYCSSEEMKADMLTKPLGHIKLQRFSEGIGLVAAD